MQGANEYAKIFEDGQRGRLYFKIGSHARGSTFRIYVLPECEKAVIKYAGHPPANKDAVEVYGIIGGLHGWTERYGWIHKGTWQDDFEKIYKDRVAEINKLSIIRDNKKDMEEVAKKNRKQKLLEGY